jgi:predicted nicotinamide N-methyase
MEDGGFAGSFVPLLQQATDSWFDSIRRVNIPVTRIAGEKKQNSSDTGEVEESSRPVITDCPETEVLRRLLQIHVSISRLDSTLAEELGRQGSHLLLSRLVCFDPSSIVQMEEDCDAVMELQDLACQVAAGVSSFPLKVAPFSRYDLLARLPLVFSIQSIVVLIHQVTKRRQSAQDDVGFVLWPSAVALSRWLVANPHVLENKRVLELGAGCGLTGLVAAKIQQQQCNYGPSEQEANDNCWVTLTDFNPLVLENIQRNIALNDIELADTAKLDFYEQSGRSISGWVGGGDDHQDGQEPVLKDPVDVVLAADVICQPNDAVAAANSIHDALKLGGTAIVVCADSKHRYGVDHFEEECRRLGLCIKTADVSDLCDGQLLDENMEKTTGYVQGMRLTMFWINKPNN